MKTQIFSIVLVLLGIGSAAHSKDFDSYLGKYLVEGDVKEPEVSYLIKVPGVRPSCESEETSDLYIQTRNYNGGEVLGHHLDIFFAFYMNKEGRVQIPAFDNTLGWIHVVGECYPSYMKPLEGPSGGSFYDHLNLGYESLADVKMYVDFKKKGMKLARGERSQFLAIPSLFREWKRFKMTRIEESP